MAAAATMALPNGFIPSGKAVLRTSSDEAADRDEFVENMTREAYKEWPNEAGVSHVPQATMVLSSTNPNCMPC